MRLNFLFLPLCLLSGIASAKHGHTAVGQKDTIQHIMLDTLEVSAPAGLPPYQPSAPRTWEIRNTRVALSFDFKGKTANVREWVKLAPYFFTTDSLVLDAKSMQIDSVKLVGKHAGEKLSYVYKADVLKIKFDHRFQCSDSLELYLKYVSMPYGNQTGGSSAISDDRGLYFINTDYSTPYKPAEIWTQGETESNSHWMITVDKPNTRFTTQIELTVPDSFTTLSNGALLKQTKAAGGLRTDSWKMDMPIQAYAVMFAIGKFTIVKDKWRNKEVNFYVEPEYAPYARLMFNRTSEMMEYFSERTGVPYPWNKYSQVVARDYVSGAMENTSASLFGEFMNQDAREIADKNSEDVVSHELFHQWFGDYVTCESWSNITVNESFANYGEQLWDYHKHGKAAGDELAWADLQKYIGSTLTKDPQLVRFNYDNREEVFDAISYNKGGAILHYLNTIIGDEAFDRAMKLYLTKNALHSAEAHNWRLAVEEATGLDWNWFFNEWYYRAGHPVLKVTSRYNDTTQKVTVTVSQVQQDSSFNYRLPLKATLFTGSQTEDVDWLIDKRNTTFVYDYKNGIRPVVLPDCQHVLPGTVKDSKKPEQWLTVYKGSGGYVSKLLALREAFKQLSDSASQEIVTLALSDSLKAIRQVAVSWMDDVQSEKYKRLWTGKIISLAKTDSIRQVRAAALGQLGVWQVTSAKRDIVNALKDSSYLVVGRALEALKKIDKDTAYICALKLLEANPGGQLKFSILGVIAAKAADEDVKIFEQIGPHYQGAKKFQFTVSLSTYLNHVKSDASFERGVKLFAYLVQTEGLRTYRIYLGASLFQLAGDVKNDSKSDNKEEAATAERRLGVLRDALQQVIDAEKDDAAKIDFEKQFKSAFKKD